MAREVEGEERLLAARRFTRGAYIQRGRPQAAVPCRAAAVAAVETHRESNTDSTDER